MFWKKQISQLKDWQELKPILLSIIIYIYGSVGHTLMCIYVKQYQDEFIQTFYSFTIRYIWLFIIIMIIWNLTHALIWLLESLKGNDQKFNSFFSIGIIFMEHLQYVHHVRCTEFIWKTLTLRKLRSQSPIHWVSWLIRPRPCAEL